MWLHDMAKQKSMIDPELPVDHDYNFLQTYCTSLEKLNSGSIAKIYISDVNDEQRFDGFCVCFQPQIQRIFRADIRAFTLEVRVNAPALSNTNRTNSRDGHGTPCAPWIQTPTWCAWRIACMTRKTKRATTGYWVYVNKSRCTTTTLHSSSTSTTS